MLILRPNRFHASGLKQSSGFLKKDVWYLVSFSVLNGTSIVFVLENQDKVRAQKVEVGEILNGGKVEIRSGLTPGARVVIDGAGYVKDGDKVKVALNGERLTGNGEWGMGNISFITPNSQLLTPNS